jgi:hypothetical protein
MAAQVLFYFGRFNSLTARGMIFAVQESLLITLDKLPTSLMSLS